MTTMYDLLGGEEAVAKIVERFYDLMDLEPPYVELRQTHGETLDYARDRLFKFLSGWLGGPPLYETLYGHPRLRQRHMPFEVTAQTRDQWLACFAQALAETDTAAEYAEPMLLNLFAMGDWMRNQDEPDHPPPQPPMVADPQMLLLQLREVLRQYGVDAYFQTASNRDD